MWLTFTAPKRLPSGHMNDLPERLPFTIQYRRNALNYLDLLCAEQRHIRAATRMMASVELTFEK